MERGRSSLSGVDTRLGEQVFRQCKFMYNKHEFICTRASNHFFVNFVICLLGSQGY